VRIELLHLRGSRETYIDGAMEGRSS